MRTQGQCTRMEGPQLTKANPMLGILRVFFGAKSVAKPPFLGDFSTIPGPTGPNIHRGRAAGLLLGEAFLGSQGHGHGGLAGAAPAAARGAHGARAGHDAGGGASAAAGGSRMGWGALKPWKPWENWAYFTMKHGENPGLTMTKLGV